MLDVSFSEDSRSVTKYSAPEVLSLIRRVVINMLSLDTTQPDFAKQKLNKSLKRKFTNLEKSIMPSILGIQPLWPSREKALPKG